MKKSEKVKVVVFSVWFVVMLIIAFSPWIVEARPLDLTPQEWGEELRSRETQPPSPEAAQKPVETEPEASEALPEPASDCTVWESPNPGVFIFKDWCRDWALTVIPQAPGQVLYCKLADSELSLWGVFAGEPGHDGTEGWNYCQS